MENQLKHKLIKNTEHRTYQGSICNKQYTLQRDYHVDTTRINPIYYACIIFISTKSWALTKTQIWKLREEGHRSEFYIIMYES
jgi:hypothetical protein